MISQIAPHHRRLLPADSAKLITERIELGSCLLGESALNETAASCNPVPMAACRHAARVTI
jgi:hypothetical protein